MRRVLPAVLLALALAGCASPQADLQDQVADVTAAANRGDVQGLLSEAATLEQLVDRLEGSGDLPEAEATRFRNAAVALQQRAGQLRRQSPAPVPSPTPSEEPPPSEEPSPEPSPTPSEEPSPEPSPTPSEQPSPSPSRTPDVPVPPVVTSPSSDSAASPSPAAFSSPEATQAPGTSSSSRRSPAPSPSAPSAGA